MPPRPRPRPKPKLRSGNNSQSLEGVPPTQDEEDSIFIKSSNLTTATWKRMNKMPSGVFALNHTFLPFDKESAHEPREDSINYGDQHKAAKKVGGKELIPKLYSPLLLDDLLTLTTSYQSQISIGPRRDTVIIYRQFRRRAYTFGELKAAP